MQLTTADATPEPPRPEEARPPAEYQRSASGLRYLDVRRGPSDAPLATLGQAVRIRYCGRLLSGASRSVGGGRVAVWEVEQRDVTLGLGRGGARSIWDEGVPGMRVGGVRRVLVPPGATLRPLKKGARDTIPPGETAVYDCELLRVEAGGVALAVRFGLLGEGSVLLPLLSIAALNSWLWLVLYPWLVGTAPASATTLPSLTSLEPVEHRLVPCRPPAPLTVQPSPPVDASAALLLATVSDSPSEYPSAEQAQESAFAAAEAARAASARRIDAAKSGFEARVAVVERAFAAAAFVDACDDLALYVIGEGRIPEGARLGIAVGRIRSTYNALPSYPVPCEGVGNGRGGTKQCYTHAPAAEKAYSALLRELKKYARKGLDVNMSGGTELPNFVGGQSF
jgi:FKBP-type peptidyl-prolyl cis-trans isomerase FkpA